MQTARYPFRQHVVPHPPGAVGSIAGNEARPDLGAHLFIAAAASTARSRQPAIEATPRDTERPAQPIRRPDPPVLRNETDLVYGLEHKAEGLRSPMQVVYHSRAVSGLISRRTRVYIFHPVLHGIVEQHCDLARRGSHCLGLSD